MKKGEKAEARTRKVAAVQVVSENGQIERNLARAEPFITEAVERGAELVVLPEFLAAGYIFTRDIWDGAEPHDGPTVAWLRDNSRRHGIWMGSTFLEAEGEDFYNTFVLTNPEGAEDGRVRKQTPAGPERYFTRGEAGPHMIESDLGVVGVGICYENMLSYTPKMMYGHSVDLMLMPHSAPGLTPKPWFMAGLGRYHVENLRGLAARYARMLGIPTVYVNKAGQWKSPLPFLPLMDQDSAFPGLSAIADSDGTVVAQLGDEEGVIVGEVTLDPERKTKCPPHCRGRWSKQEPIIFNAFRLFEGAGAVWYQLSGERRRRALEISGRGSEPVD